MMRILFIGCVKSSELFLKRMFEEKVNIVGVVTKSESTLNADFVDLGELCRKQNVDYMYVKNINDLEAKQYIKSKNADLILCLGWSQLLDKEILNMPKFGCVGFHPAALPHNKGHHPLIWALALGLKRTASTLFLMDEKADAGKIISQHYVNIDYEDDASTLYDKIMKVAVEQMSELLKDLGGHLVNSLPQLHEEGNSWRKRSKEDGKIDWRMSSRGIYNLVRALTKPYVGAHFSYEGKDYKVWKVREVFDNGYENIEPGKIIKVISDNNFIIKTGDYLIEVLSCEDIRIKEGQYL